jgi:hypothetical protein
MAFAVRTELATGVITVITGILASSAFHDAAEKGRQAKPASGRFRLLLGDTSLSVHFIVG